MDNLQPLHTRLKIVCGHSANQIAALVLVLLCILENSTSSVANQKTPFVVERWLISIYGGAFRVTRQIRFRSIANYP